jgi:hypothetical protein
LKRAFLALAGLALLTTGCQTNGTSEGFSFNEAPEQYLKRCTGRASHMNPSAKIELAQYMRVSREKVPETLCKRVLAGFQDGRLNQGDVVELGHDRSSPVWKVIRG